MNNILSRMSSCAKALTLATTMMLGGLQSPAQTQASRHVSATFKVCPLNVDGLPNSILHITINPDGKGAPGAKAIGEYIAKSGIDVLALSEDFNYHDDLMAAVGDGYMKGTYRGGLSTGTYNASIRFNTDGLEYLTRLPAVFDNESWTAWNKSNGKFTNGADELITKGYRHYTVCLGADLYVDFYTMHMDADTDPADNAARASQWEQLRDAILANRSGRPVIVMGDTNSRYTRDDILGLFTNPVDADGRYTVRDVWVDMCQGGVYPKLGADALVIPDGQKQNPEAYRTNEIVDKVLYLDPTAAGGLHLTPTAISYDADGYVGTDGELMGDHVPVVVTFKLEGDIAVDYAPAVAAGWWRGEAWRGNDQEVYLYNVRYQCFISNDAKPTVTDIEKAPTWFIRHGAGADPSSDNFTIDNAAGYRLQMSSLSQGVVQGSGATTFTNHEDGMTPGSHRIGLKKTWSGITETTRFFAVADEGGLKYTNAKTKDTGCDWLLISPEQKAAYARYAALYEEARGLLVKDDLSDDLRKDLSGVLAETSSGNYGTCAKDTADLKDIIERVCAHAYLDVTVTSAGYATTCLPWNARVPEGVTIFYASEYNDQAMPHRVRLVAYEGDVIPAGQGVVVRADVPADYRFVRVTDASPSVPADNMLFGTTDDIAASSLDTQNNTYLMLANKTSGVGFYPLAAGVGIKAHRAYLVRAAGSQGTDAMTLLDFGGATAVTLPSVTPEVRPESVYSLSGVRRTRAVRGVNLVRMSDGTVRKVTVR